MNILNLKNVKKSYEKFNLDIDLAVNKNETVGFVGQNGAGKTTTMNIILNIIKRDAGTVSIFGLDNVKNEAEVKERMGIVLEDHVLYKDIKIDYILKFCSSFYPKWSWERAKSLREKFDLTQNKKFQELSKGMKVKLFLIIALSIGAEFWLFDEPTSGLDPKVRHDILDEIKKIKESDKPSILFSSHNMLDIEELSDRIVMIDKGKIVFDETKANLLNEWKLLTLQSDKEIEFDNYFDVFNVLKKDNFQYEVLVKKLDEESLKKMQDNLSLNIDVIQLSLEQIFLKCLEFNKH